MNKVIRYAVCALSATFCLGVSAAAVGRPDPPDRPDKKSSVRRTPGTVRSVGSGSTGATVGGGASAIRGAAWTAENNPIKQAQLRLRNVVTGQIEAKAVADDLGQFAFDSVQAGSYVVELVGDSGQVVVVGHMFSIAQGETVATFVRTGAKVPWFNGFFGSTVQSVTSTAASEGITAIAPVARSSSIRQ